MDPFSIASLVGSGASAIGSQIFGRKARKKGEALEQQALQQGLAGLAQQRGILDTLETDNALAAQQARKVSQRRTEAQRQDLERKQARRGIVGTPAQMAQSQEFQKQAIQSGDDLASTLAQRRQDFARQKATSLSDIAGREAALRSGATSMQAQRAYQDPRAGQLAGFSKFLAGEAFRGVSPESVKGDDPGAVAERERRRASWDRPFGGIRSIFGK